MLDSVYCAKRSSVAVSLWLMAVSLLGNCGAVWPQESDQDTVRAAMEKAVAAVKPALVRIHVVEVDYQEGREIKSESVGSGVIISKDGNLVTNHHVAGHAKQIVCTMADKEEIDARLIGTDALTDIAVLKLVPPAPREFAYAVFGDSSALKVGDRVLAMGSPLAFSQSVTMGVVSNTELVMPQMWHESLTLDGEDVGSMVRWIGHDAAIYGGNSGGPLVNMEGQIVGINEISMGLGGAIPGNLVKQVADEIIRNGKVIRSWLGITVQPLLKSSDVKNGVLIGGVLPDSPAARSGLKPGDIITRVAGQNVSVRFPEELPIFNQLISSLPPGREIEITVYRSAGELPVRVTPEVRQEVEAKPREFKQWGICASNITFFTAKEKKRKNQDGVLVTSLRPGGPCGDAKPAIAEDDIIVEAAGIPIKNLDDLVTATEKITAGQSEPVPTLVSFDRNSERLLTVVRVGVKELEDPGREVSKAWLPVATQVLTTDLAEALGLSGKTGVRVTQVYPNSAASKAGLQVGDVIVALDDAEIPASQPEDEEVLPAMIRQYKINSKAELTVIRAGQELKIAVVLPASPPLQREMKKYRDLDFDFTVRDIAFLDRIETQIPEQQQGVLVESVGEGGWASLGGLMLGDLICSVDGQKVTGVLNFEKIMRAVADKKPKTVVLQVKRGIRDSFIEIKPSWPNSK